MTRPASADVAALAARVRAARPGLGPVRLVCIDGPAGSGKTTLAAALAERLGTGIAGPGGAVVVHLDDLYEGWAGLGGVWERVEAQILAPLAESRPGRWQRYDWGAGRFAEWRDLPVPQYLVLEGCGSAPRAVDGRAALKIFVEAPDEVRLARGVARDGEHLRARWLAWMAEEVVEFARERTKARADVVVDGTADLASATGFTDHADSVDRADLTDWLSAPAPQVAPFLLGAHLTTVLPDGVVTVRLTKVEAYGANDPGSHAFRGRTARNAVMFGPAGHLYVYRHLGLHMCANVVTGVDGRAAAVLLRAGEVVAGVEVARARRLRRGVVRAEADLARGPARLADALGITLDLYGTDLTDDAGPVRLVSPATPAHGWVSGPRVGVSGVGGDGAAFPWRFWLPGEATVSAYRPAQVRRRRG